MGNHEYCTECEQSDFHYGEPCNPEHLAKAQARRAKIEAHNDQARKVAIEHVGILQRLGYPAKLNSYGGIEICRFELLRSRPEYKNADD